MRKFIISIALLLIPCLLLSCTDINGENVETSEFSSDSAVAEVMENTAEGKLNSDKTLPLLDTLSDYLTDEGYTDIKEETLKSILSNYSLEGASLFDLIPGTVYEGSDHVGDNSGGTIGMDTGFGFGYHWHYSYPDNGDSIEYSYFYTHVLLDGLSLPHGINFEDKVTDVFKKFGLEFDPDNFIPDDKDDRTKVTLLTSNESSLIFLNYHFSDSATSSNEYYLQFTDIYYWERWDRVKFPYTRELTLCFDDSGKLYRVRMQISS